MYKQVKIGIDLGATRIKIGLVDNKGRTSHRHEVDTPLGSKRIDIIDSIVDNVKDLITKADLRKKYIAGVGIGVPGPVDFKKGVVRYFPNINADNHFLHLLPRRHRRQNL